MTLVPIAWEKERVVVSGLGWKPRTSFKGLVRLIVESDLDLARKEVRARG